MTTPFLEIENLTKDFAGIKAVHNVSFQIGGGEVVGLIGPNGAGKTTIIRLITSILKPTSGRIKFKGEDITGKKTSAIINKGIAPTFQIVKPFRNLPVLTNVMVSCLSPRARKKEEWVKTVEQRALDALEFCGIANLAFEAAAVLSHGDLKRLELARALATEPELLLLDEPFGGLSPAETTLIAKSLKRLHKGGRFGRLHSEGPAMLIVEHKLMDLMKIVDRVIVINFGELIASGPPADIVVNQKVIGAYIGKGVSNLVS
jgi:branched-chain amino acid transport system ATP-binding protein